MYAMRCYALRTGMRQTDRVDQISQDGGFLGYSPSEKLLKEDKMDRLPSKLPFSKRRLRPRIIISWVLLLGTNRQPHC